MTDPREPFEDHLRETARAFAYPRTPDVARAVKSRLGQKTPLAPNRLRPALVMLVVIAFLGLVLLPTQVRADLLAWLQIGGVRVMLPASTPTPTAEAPHTATPRVIVVTAVPTPAPPKALTPLRGRTTLAAAQAKVKFPLRLPTYPADLGQPADVFFQTMGGEPMVILVWRAAADPSQIRFSLHYVLCQMCVTKFEPKVITTTTVNGQPALWTEGPYLVQFSNGNLSHHQLVTGHVLIWTEGALTLRLETTADLAEAVKVAESLPLVEK